MLLLMKLGIHQDGMLKNRNTYEIMTPESVGVKQTSLVMGKHSGRHAFKEKLNDLGYAKMLQMMLFKQPLVNLKF